MTRQQRARLCELQGEIELLDRWANAKQYKTSPDERKKAVGRIKEMLSTDNYQDAEMAIKNWKVDGYDGLIIYLQTL